MNIRFPIFKRQSQIADSQPNYGDVLGLIAGQGRLPFLVASGAKRAG
jgi:DUF1009 family protein